MVDEVGNVPYSIAFVTALVTSARDALGDELFDSTWAEGRALGYDAALEHARRALHPTGLSASS